MEFNKRVTVIVVSGVIGVGKSTLLSLIPQYIPQEFTEYYVDVLHEPVAYWKEQGWLQAFYDDPEKKAFVFQMGVYSSAIDNVRKKLKACPDDVPVILFIERYIYDQLLFWRVNCDDEKRGDAMDDTIYMSFWHKWRHFIPEPSGYILLVNDEHLDRVRRRGRKEELKASTEDGGEKFKVYQTKLHEKHMIYFEEPIAHPPHAPNKGIPCIHVNTGDIPYHECKISQENVMERITKWIKSII